MPEPKRQAPFRTLGKHLRFLREGRQESVAEVSGAVEITIETLERIERGEERPSEDILMLLINHFGMSDNEAVQLWETAGYEKENSDRFHPANDLPARATMVLLALDVRTMYSDGVDITSNKSGLVMQFTQSGNQAQSLPVARVGMSYEQAKTVLHELEQAILRGQYLGGPKSLPEKIDPDSPQKFS